MVELEDYLSRSLSALSELKAARLDDKAKEAVDVIVRTLLAKKPLLVCGNGGSAADAQHIAGELVGRFLKERNAYNVIALSTDAAVSSAWSNDYSYETLLARQVRAYGSEGAALLAISTSGNSRNVVAAAEAAREIGMSVISMTGRGGGALAPLSDILLDVPSNFTPLIQQSHLCLYHFLCGAIEDRMEA